MVRLTPAGDRLFGELLTEQRPTLAELSAELHEADQRKLLQALESLRAVLARHPESVAGCADSTVVVDGRAAVPAPAGSTTPF